ncbi:MAG: autoinducer binding domain-containing protein [Pseudomonadota bacterium]
MSKATARNDSFQTQVSSLDDGARTMSNSAAIQADLESAFSEDSLTAEYGYYIELSSASDVGEFKRKIDNAVKRLGFSDFAFVRLSGAEDSGKLVTVAPELMDAYYKAGLYEHDMAIQHAAQQTQHFFRSVINEHVFQMPFSCDHTRCMIEADELNRSFGYYDFYNIPSKAKNGEGNVVLSVTRRGMPPAALKRKIKDCYSDLQLLCDAIDFVSTRSFPGELLGEERDQSRKIKINPRPLVVLDMLANNDLNITEVAGELGINVVTANRHLQAARRAFGVKTNHAAIKLGILNKLIEYK